MIVKICGITTLSDALAAIDLGADMLGYNFYSGSKRYLPPEECARIQGGIARSGRQVLAAGVFVNATSEAIDSICSTCALDYAQLSGDEMPDLLHSLTLPWIKAIHPAGTGAALAEARRYSANWPSGNSQAKSGVIPDLLLDANHPSEFGGTGQTGDWGAAQILAEKLPILLAGGLKPENVAAAVQQVRPAGVDVASGVESSPGRKDHHKMERFIRSARRAAT